MAKKKSDTERTKTSLSLSKESKRILAHLKADLRAEDIDATESSILETLLLHTSADAVARLHPKRKP